MDPTTFDRMTKRLGVAETRRGFLRGLAALPLVGILAAYAGEEAEAGHHHGHHNHQKKPCGGAACGVCFNGKGRCPCYKMNRAGKACGECMLSCQLPCTTNGDCSPDAFCAKVNGAGRCVAQCGIDPTSICP